ncbi:hypothetical protein L208DRAFT_1314852 [Tricholoma matsutake]|nr:hypothetical protein L208DRAFT_1314852 [Tricholoma matsutake 945]
MALYQHRSSSKALPPSGKTEFEILKESHRFLREDHDENLSWDDQLAAKYYSSLYREFAVCDLKHYKSGNFALRWRTEDEVLSGNGETTCGNTRCEFHDIPERLAHLKPSLTTLELPFAYVEQGENKSALVKVVLCPRCLRKLMWKRSKEKEIALEQNSGEPSKNMLGLENITIPAPQEDIKMEEVDVVIGKNSPGHRPENQSTENKERRYRRRNSRSRSPRHNHTTALPSRRR